MKLLKKYLMREVDELDRNNVRMLVIGEKDRLSADLREVVDDSVARLSKNTGLTLVFAISYGSRRELARAAKLFAQDCVKGRAKPEDMTEELMRQYLWTSALGDLDEVDLIIRTSGEKRVSNFLLWQAAYAEFVFSDLLWPDFTAAHLRCSNRGVHAPGAPLWRRHAGACATRGSNLNPELRKRVITGLLGGAALLLVIIFGGGVGIFLLATALSLVMIDEFSRMVFGMADREEKRYVLLFSAWFIALGAALLPHTEFELLVFSFLGLFIYYLVAAKRHLDQLNAHFKDLMFSIFGLVYLALLPTYLPKIHGAPNGVHWVIVFLFINWATDTGAYFAGRKYGRTKLYALISPKKTREGGTRRNGDRLDRDAPL